jgi:hypothetical protein
MTNTAQPPRPTGGHSGPSSAWTGCSVVIASSAYNGRLYHWWQRAHTTAWHPHFVD